MNPSDFVLSLVKEVTTGVTPANPAFLNFAYIPGDMPQLASEVVTSAVLRAKRASIGTRKTSLSVTDSLKTELRRDPAIDVLLESAVSGTFSSNVLKASNVDSSFSIEKKMPKGGTTYYHVYKGCMVSTMTISASLAAASEVTFGLIGLERTEGTTAITGATYAATPTNDLAFLMDRDITVTIDGVSAKYREMSLTVEHTREVKHAFGGTGVGHGIGTDGIRSVKLNLSAYRDDLSLDTLFARSDDTVSITVSVGSGDEGYSFKLGAAQCATPRDAVEGSSAVVALEFTGSYAAGDDTDLVITKLA